MDLGSHALMGLSIAASAPGGLTWESGLACGVASIAPDLIFVPLGVALGRHHRRPLWVPRAADWQGARARYPRATALSWDLPYSLLGAAVVVSSLAWWLGGAVALAYALHLAIDYPTHTGEWAVRPLYPFSSWPLPGGVSAWEWPLAAMAASWAVLTALLLLLVYR